MKTILNIIWLILCGFWMFLGYLLAGLLLCVTIIGIPFGIAAFRIGLYALWPFGYTVVDRRDAGAPSCVGNVLWLVLAGWWLALGHIVTGIALCVTIIGIPSWHRQLQADPGVAASPGQGDDRPHGPAVRRQVTRAVAGAVSERGLCAAPHPDGGRNRAAFTGVFPDEQHSCRVTQHGSYLARCARTKGRCPAWASSAGSFSVCSPGR